MFHGATHVAAIVAAVVVLLIGAFLLIEAGPALRHIGLVELSTGFAWRPLSPSEPRFGMAPMLTASVLMASSALLLAAPLGVLSAVFVRFYAPHWLAQATRRVIEVAAGIPSVVYGLWGLVCIVPVVRRLSPPGPSLLAGALVLALMVTPTITLLADAAFGGVAPEVSRGAEALGLRRWRAVVGVHLPAARSGLASALLLAGARGLGETMAVMMVAGNVVQMPHSVFDPVRTLTANIALEMAYALELHRAALFASGLLLVLLVTAAVLTARRVSAAAFAIDP